VVRATIRALRRGYGEAQNDPDSAVTALTTANPDLDREAADAQLDAVAPAFTAGADAYGQLREDVLEQWAHWDLQFGIVKQPIDVGSAFDFSLAAP
jgi:ABC-type nitrate/sulfonate/bicarbonate transport system substrate-binding protein